MTANPHVISGFDCLGMAVRRSGGNQITRLTCSTRVSNTFVVVFPLCTLARSNDAEAAACCEPARKFNIFMSAGGSANTWQNTNFGRMCNDCSKEAFRCPTDDDQQPRICIDGLRLDVRLDTSNLLCRFGKLRHSDEAVEERKN